jgi:hypothetical protein
VPEGAVVSERDVRPWLRRRWDFVHLKNESEMGKEGRVMLKILNRGMRGCRR